MKVTPSNNTQPSISKKVDKQSTRNDVDSSAADDLTPGEIAEKSDFASVLARVTRSHKEPESRHAERRSDGPSETHEAKSGREEKAEDDAYLAVADRMVTREGAVSGEVNTDAAPILHTADLEKIVSVCRLQLDASGQRTVTLELSRSVLEGLRVKVSADAAGRVTAEFLAANDGIKSLLDSRSPELIELLRSRGINLAEFKSSVAADANSGGDSRRGQNPATQVASRAARSGGSESISAAESEPATEAADGLASGATYRA